jgi:hypothetical protein
VQGKREAHLCEKINDLMAQVANTQAYASNLRQWAFKYSSEVANELPKSEKDDLRKLNMDYDLFIIPPYEPSSPYIFMNFLKN